MANCENNLFESAIDQLFKTLSENSNYDLSNSLTLDEKIKIFNSIITTDRSTFDLILKNFSREHGLRINIDPNAQEGRRYTYEHVNNMTTTNYDDDDKDAMTQLLSNEFKLLVSTTPYRVINNEIAYLHYNTIMNVIGREMSSSTTYTRTGGLEEFKEFIKSVTFSGTVSSDEKLMMYAFYMRFLANADEIANDPYIKPIFENRPDVQPIERSVKDAVLNDVAYPDLINSVLSFVNSIATSDTISIKEGVLQKPSKVRGSGERQVINNFINTAKPYADYTVKKGVIFKNNVEVDIVQAFNDLFNMDIKGYMQSVLPESISPFSDQNDNELKNSIKGNADYKKHSEILTRRFLSRYLEFRKQKDDLLIKRTALTSYPEQLKIDKRIQEVEDKFASDIQSSVKNYFLSTYLAGNDSPTSAVKPNILGNNTAVNKIGSPKDGVKNKIARYKKFGKGVFANTNVNYFMDNPNSLINSVVRDGIEGEDDIRAYEKSTLIERFKYNYEFGFWNALKEGNEVFMNYLVPADAKVKESAVINLKNIKVGNTTMLKLVQDRDYKSIYKFLAEYEKRYFTALTNQVLADYRQIGLDVNSLEELDAELNKLSEEEFFKYVLKASENNINLVENLHYNKGDKIGIRNALKARLNKTAEEYVDLYESIGRKDIQMFNAEGISVDNDYLTFHAVDVFVRSQLQQIETSPVETLKSDSEQGSFLSYKAYIDSIKRAKPAATSQRQNYAVGIKGGVPEFERIVIIEDLKEELNNIMGDKHKQDLFDGASLITYVGWKRQQTSLGGTEGTYQGMNSKNINTSEDPWSGLNSSEKKAQFISLGNEMLRLSVDADYDLNKVLKKMWNQPLGKIDNNNRVINKYNGGKKTFNIGDSLSMNPLGNIKLYKKLPNQEQEEITSISIDNNTTYWDLFQALGGAYSGDVLPNGDFVYNNNSQEAMWQLITALDLDSEPNRLLFKTGIKTNIPNPNPESSFTNNSPFAFALMSNVDHGVQLNAEHDVEGYETTMMTQVLSALIHEGRSSGAALNVYKAIRQLIDIKLKEEFDKSDAAATDPAAREFVLELIKKEIKARLETSSGSAKSKAKDWVNELPASEFPFDSPQIRGLATSVVTSLFTNEAIRLKFPGGQMIVSPGYGMVKLYKLPQGTMYNKKPLEKSIKVARPAYEKWLSENQNTTKPTKIENISDLKDGVRYFFESSFRTKEQIIAIIDGNYKGGLKNNLYRLKKLQLLGEGEGVYETISNIFKAKKEPITSNEIRYFTDLYNKYLDESKDDKSQRYSEKKQNFIFNDLSFSKQDRAVINKVLKVLSNELQSPTATGVTATNILQTDQYVEKRNYNYHKKKVLQNITQEDSSAESVNLSEGDLRFSVGGKQFNKFSIPQVKTLKELKEQLAALEKAKQDTSAIKEQIDVVFRELRTVLQGIQDGVYIEFKDGVEVNRTKLDNGYEVDPVEVGMPLHWASEFGIKPGMELQDIDVAFFQSQVNEELAQLDARIDELDREETPNDALLERLTAKKLALENADIAEQRYASFQQSLEFILARIPAQGMQSFMRIKVAFVTYDMGNIVIAPPHMLWWQGADMDIDKGNLMGYTVKDKMLVGWNKDFDVRDKSTWNKFAPKEVENPELATKNYIVYQMSEVSDAPANFPAKEFPMGFGEMKEIADNSANANREKDFNLYSFFSQLSMEVSNDVGKDVIGVAATSLKVYSAILTAYLSVEGYGNSKMFKDGGFQFNGKWYVAPANIKMSSKAVEFLFDAINTGKSEALITDFLENKEALEAKFLKENNGSTQAWAELSGLLSAATDNAKELILAKVNIDIQTAGIVSTAIMYGVPVKEVLTLMLDKNVEAAIKKSKKNIFDPDEYISLTKAIEEGLSDKSKLSGEEKKVLEDFLMFSKFSDELRVLGEKLAINQGIPKEEYSLFAFANSIESYIAGQSEENMEFDFLTFIKDTTYRNQKVAEYNNHKANINILFVLANNEQFMAQLRGYAASYDMAFSKGYFIPSMKALITQLKQEIPDITITDKVYKKLANVVDELAISNFYNTNPELKNISIDGVSYDLSSPETFIKDFDTIIDKYKTQFPNSLFLQNLVKADYSNPLTGEKGKVWRLIDNMYADGLDAEIIESKYKIDLRTISNEKLPNSSIPLIDILFIYNQFSLKNKIGSNSYAKLIENSTYDDAYNKKYIGGLGMQPLSASDMQAVIIKARLFRLRKIKTNEQGYIQPINENLKKAADGYYKVIRLGNISFHRKKGELIEEITFTEGSLDQVLNPQKNISISLTPSLTPVSNKDLKDKQVEIATFKKLSNAEQETLINTWKAKTGITDELIAKQSTDQIIYRVIRSGVYIPVTNNTPVEAVVKPSVTVDSASTSPIVIDGKDMIIQQTPTITPNNDGVLKVDGEEILNSNNTLVLDKDVLYEIKRNRIPSINLEEILKNNKFEINNTGKEEDLYKEYVNTIIDNFNTEKLNDDYLDFGEESFKAYVLKNYNKKVIPETYGYIHSVLEELFNNTFKDKVFKVSSSINTVIGKVTGTQQQLVSYGPRSTGSSIATPKYDVLEGTPEKQTSFGKNKNDYKIDLGPALIGFFNMLHINHLKNIKSPTKQSVRKIDFYDISTKEKSTNIEDFINQNKEKLQQASEISVPAEYVKQVKELLGVQTEQGTTELTQPLGTKVKDGIYINQQGLTKDEQLELFEIVKPVFENSGKATNMSKAAPVMAAFGLNWDYKKNRPNSTPIWMGEDIRGTEASKSREVFEKPTSSTYAYYDTDAYGNPLQPIPERLKELVSKVTGIDLSDYDAMIMNLYTRDSWIPNHPDEDESKTAIKYPVAVANIGGNGTINFDKDNYQLESGSGYVFGYEGKNRRIYHNTKLAPEVNGFLPEITVKNAKGLGKSLTFSEGDYRITITLRRAKPVDGVNVPVQPKLISATQTNSKQGVKTKLNQVFDKYSFSTQGKSRNYIDMLIEEPEYIQETIWAALEENEYRYLSTVIEDYRHKYDTALDFTEEDKRIIKEFRESKEGFEQEIKTILLSEQQSNTTQWIDNNKQQILDSKEIVVNTDELADKINDVLAVIPDVKPVVQQTFTDVVTLTLYHRSDRSNFNFDKFKVELSGNKGSAGATYGKGLYVTDKNYGDITYGKNIYSREFTFDKNRIFTATTVGEILNEANAIRKANNPSTYKWINTPNDIEIYNALSSKYDLIDLRGITAKPQLVLLTINPVIGQTNTQQPVTTGQSLFNEGEIVSLDSFVSKLVNAKIPSGKLIEILESQGLTETEIGELIKKHCNK